MTQDFEELCLNTIRFLAVDAVEKANSGHPGAPMGMAAMAYTLWQRFLKHNPADPGWADRDRFVLSAGHASMLLYALLYLTGYDLSLDDLKNFRQWGAARQVIPNMASRQKWRPPPAAGPGLRQRRGHGHRRASPGCRLQQTRF